MPLYCLFGVGLGIRAQNIQKNVLIVEGLHREGDGVILHLIRFLVDVLQHTFLLVGREETEECFVALSDGALKVGRAECHHLGFSVEFQNVSEDIDERDGCFLLGFVKLDLRGLSHQGSSLGADRFIWLLLPRPYDIQLILDPHLFLLG